MVIARGGGLGGGLGGGQVTAGWAHFVPSLSLLPATRTALLAELALAPPGPFRPAVGAGRGGRIAEGDTSDSVTDAAPFAKRLISAHRPAAARRSPPPRIVPYPATTAVFVSSARMQQSPVAPH